MKNTDKNQSKKRVRRSPEMIVNLIFEAERKGNVAEICRREGINPNLFYRWKAKFRECGINELKQMKRGRKAATAVDQEKLEIQAENAKLKSSVCDHSVELLLLKKERALGLHGSLIGRHLTLEQRKSLLALIDEGISISESLQTVCRILEINRCAVYRWREQVTAPEKSHGGGGGLNKIQPKEERAVIKID